MEGMTERIAQLEKAVKGKQQLISRVAALEKELSALKKEKRPEA